MAQPAKDNGLKFGPLGAGCVHICTDMQRIFAEDTPWQTPWMTRVLPQVMRIVESHAEDTIFTRFIPAARPGEGRGTWKRYYDKWADLTVERIGADRLDLVADLRAHVPPAQCLDKKVYSPWYQTDLEQQLSSRAADTLIVTGGETEVCVLSCVLGAIDRGYRVVLVVDALCSSSDETHDALLKVYHERYGVQLETLTTDGLLAAWR